MRKTHREICSLCHEVSRVGFSVPDKIWKLAVHRSQINDIICLRCFTRLADERKVQWDEKIEFYPISQITDKDNPTNKNENLNFYNNKPESEFEDYKAEYPHVPEKQLRNEWLDNSGDLRHSRLSVETGNWP